MSTRRKVQTVTAACCWALLALTPRGVVAQVMREDAALVDAPDGKAVVLNVKAGTAAKAVKRQGFWVQVDVGGKTGWIKASALNFSSGGGGPTAIDTGRMGQSNIVSTSSARGLSAKDLVSGQPNLEEVAWLESRATPPAALQAFLSGGGVVAASGRVQLSPPRPAAAAASAH
ncbi:MAG: SH3 domain-containing protein, partial [Betaproteobacteria bacterium]